MTRSQPNRARARVASFVVVGLGLVGVGADCQQCQQAAQARSLNTDRVADAVLMKSGDGHSFFVMTNPELQHLRVLDLTTERFLDAPNKFFPASVPVGPETRRIAKAPNDEAHAFALDASSDEVFVVDVPGFVVEEETHPTERAPADIAALKTFDPVTDDDDATNDDQPPEFDLFVTLPDQGALQIIDGRDSAILDLGPGAKPGPVEVDPTGQTVVVGDSALGVVHLISLDDTTKVDDIDVGGPVSDVAIGVVDIGDGLAPVAIVLRADANIVVAIKLFRAGFREDRYSVLGSAELPAYPLVGYVPDDRPNPSSPSSVCCRELSVEAIDASEASDAWAAVAMANGKVIYLRLAPDVRPFDDDLADLAVGDVADSDWLPQGSDVDRRPAAVLTAGDTFGSPPFVPLLDTDDAVVLIWEGAPPGLSFLNHDGDAVSTTSFTTTRDVSALDARVGDVATFIIDNPDSACFGATDTPTTQKTIEGGTVASISPDGKTIGLDGFVDDAACINASKSGIHLAIGARDAFVAFDRDDEFLGRIGFGAEGDPETSVQLPGALLTLSPADAGAPQNRGSTLTVQLAPHVSLMDLDLSDQPLRLGGGGFGSAGYLPVVITGGVMDIPSITQGVQLKNVRRMQIATGSADANGLNVVFSCDEGETFPALCDSFR